MQNNTRVENNSEVARNSRISKYQTNIICMTDSTTHTRQRLPLMR